MALGVSDDIQPDPSDPALGVTRIDRALRNALQNAVTTCAEIRRVRAKVGAAALDAELGADAAELVTKYEALRTFAAAIDNTVAVAALE